MSEPTTKVRTADGKVRIFHQAGLRTSHGFVYEGGRRVYGTHGSKVSVFNKTTGEWTFREPDFTAEGKHASLVSAIADEAFTPEREGAMV